MKDSLRKVSLEKRRNIDIHLLSVDILRNLVNFEEFKKAKNILTFFPLKKEVQLQSLLQIPDKNWFLPRIENEDLVICPFSPADVLIVSNFKTKEPQTCALADFKQLDLVITPALAVDRDKHRLGWGKGYYDRFFAKLNHNCIKIVPIFECCIFDTIPSEEHDQKCDFIVYERGIL